MSTRRWFLSVMVMVMCGSAWCAASASSGGTTVSPDVANRIGPVLATAYTFQPVYPSPPNHLWLDEGHGRIQFLMLDKPVNDPTSVLLARHEGHLLYRISAGGREDRL